MKVLVTRAQPDCAATTTRLAGRGIAAIAAPVFEIRAIEDVVLPASCRAILFTSANAPRALAGRSDIADLLTVPVYAVGARTAAAAREAGFTEVASADGDVGDLLDLVRTDIRPSGGQIVHLGGRDVAGDPAGNLAEAGYVVERIVVYEAIPAEKLPPEALAALAAGEVGAVLLYSPASVERFAALVDAAGFMGRLADVTAVAMSPNVATKARAAGFGHISVADRPDESALFEALGRLDRFRGED